jgi:hypothetical protein
MHALLRCCILTVTPASIRPGDAMLMRISSKHFSLIRDGGEPLMDSVADGL